MSLIDFGTIEAAELKTDPFAFVVAPACIPADALSRINRDYPGIEHPGNLSLEDLSYGDAFEALIDEIGSPAFAAAVGGKFGIDLSECATTVTVRKFCEKSDGNIHTDHRSKMITVLFYFNEDWSNDTGRLRMLRSDSDIEDYAAEVPPIGGTMLAFLRTDHSWHGHKTFVGERRMLQLNYLRSDRLSRLRQRIDRFGTRTMKKALRLFSRNA